jgi:hypothetical protein
LVITLYPRLHVGLIDQNRRRGVQDNSTASTHVRGKPMADIRGSPRISQGNELKTTSNSRKIPAYDHRSVQNNIYRGLRNKDSPSATRSAYIISSGKDNNKNSYDQSGERNQENIR